MPSLDVSHPLITLLAMVDSVHAASNEPPITGGQEADAWVPRLVRPVELTPLPDAERALPVLGLFGALLGRRNESYKVALLSTLAQQPRGRWRIRDIQKVLDWLEPASTTRLVGDLRRAELLLHDRAQDSYRLSQEARVVAAVCGALTVPEISNARIIKVLSSAMALARATGASEDAILAPFLSAIAILDADRDQLRQLIDDRSEKALLEAAELAQVHVADMQQLLDEQAEVFTPFGADPAFLAHDQLAHTLVAQVGRLAAELVAALSERADELMRGGLRFDRRDLRDLVEHLDRDELGGIAVGAALPPAVPPVDPVAAFAALDTYLARADRVPAEPPAPQPPVIITRPPWTPDLVDHAAAALAMLAAAGGGLLSGWVVGGSWSAAVGRHSAAVEAWSRHGPAGDATLAAVLEPHTDLERVFRDGVGLLSRTLIAPHPQEDT